MMSGFDELRGEAEKVLGKGTVARVEQEFRQHGRGQDRREIIRTGDIYFNGRDSERESSQKIRDNHAERAAARQDTTQDYKTDKESHSATLLNQAIRWEYIYGMLGLVLGLVSIVGGSILGLHGVAGSTSWTASVLGLKSQINDAAPGVVLFIVGIFLVWITKPKIKFGNLNG
jgi:hypothetical protein